VLDNSNVLLQENTKIHDIIKHKKEKKQNKIQLNSYLFACQFNSPRVNYKVSMSERKETNIHKEQNKA
jgi:hypothetical protein